MQDLSQNKETMVKNAEQVIKALQGMGGQSTAWDLKLKLRLTGSALYMALGRLEALDMISVIPEELSFKVVLLNQAEKGSKKA